MKFVIVITCFIVAISANCVPDHGNGQPSCSKDASVGKSHRNHWDPSAFWLCEAKNKAISLRCEVGSLFSAEAEKCIPAHEWNWTPSCLQNEDEHAGEEQAVE